jgi:hypothetical protein
VKGVIKLLQQRGLGVTLKIGYMKRCCSALSNPEVRRGSDGTCLLSLSCSVWTVRPLGKDPMEVFRKLIRSETLVLIFKVVAWRLLVVVRAREFPLSRLLTASHWPN